MYGYISNVLESKESQKASGFVRNAEIRHPQCWTHVYVHNVNKFFYIKEGKEEQKTLSSPARWPEELLQSKTVSRGKPMLNINNSFPDVNC
jgi:hypothetical protein